MKRTRKWEYVKQEAMRLAALGLGSVDIADRIGVERTTVYRWFKDGKLTRPAGVDSGSLGTPLEEITSAAAWAAAVRAEYQLNATDALGLKAAESVAEIWLNPLQSAGARMAAMREWRAQVAALKLYGGAPAAVDPAPKDEPKPVARPVLQRTGTDPRMALVK